MDQSITEKELLRRKRISESKKGHITSEETRQKISKSKTGQKLSEETKAKIKKWHIKAAEIVREYLEKEEEGKN